MKAKEYIIELQNKDINVETINEFIKKFLNEGQELMTNRGSSDNATLGVLREMDNKWRSIARSIPEIKPDGYRTLIIKFMPEVKNRLNW